VWGTAGQHESQNSLKNSRKTHLLSDSDQELERLRVDITDLNTTLAEESAYPGRQARASSLCEKNPVTLSDRVDADVVLGVGRVGEERFNDEGVERASGLLDELGLARALLDPSTSLLPLLVEAEKASLSASLDELIGLADEFGVEDPFGETLAGLDRRGDGLGRGVAGALARTLRGGYNAARR
jgi:hypothetical protein